jgi:hypothetical protein
VLSWSERDAILALLLLIEAIHQLPLSPGSFRSMRLYISYIIRRSLLLLLIVLYEGLRDGTVGQ